MSERNEAYEEVQRYHVYNVGGDDTYRRDEDVAELEAKYCKLLEAHRIMKETLELMTLASVTRDLAVKTLQYVAKVMS